MDIIDIRLPKSLLVSKKSSEIVPGLVVDEHGSVSLITWINARITEGSISVPSASGGIPDGDKGDIIVSNSGMMWMLDPTGATAGSYTNANITIDNKGRILSASNGSAGGVSLTDGDKGDIIVSGSGSTWTLDNSGVVAGAYESPDITIDAKGRITSVTNGDNRNIYNSGGQITEERIVRAFGSTLALRATHNTATDSPATLSLGSAGSPRIDITTTDLNNGTLTLVNSSRDIDGNELGTSSVSLTNNAGFTYADDYSSGFTARSLVDKAYVDSEVGAISTPNTDGTMVVGDGSAGDPITLGDQGATISQQVLAYNPISGTWVPKTIIPSPHGEVIATPTSIRSNAAEVEFIQNSGSGIVGRGWFYVAKNSTVNPSFSLSGGTLTIDCGSSVNKLINASIHFNSSAVPNILTLVYNTGSNSDFTVRNIQLYDDNEPTDLSDTLHAFSYQGFTAGVGVSWTFGNFSIYNDVVIVIS